MKTENLRDQIAALAAAAIVIAGADSNGSFQYDDDTVAVLAYRLADALLRARDGGR